MEAFPDARPLSGARPLAGALPEAARDLLQRERAVLGDLRALVARAELGGEGERDLATALDDLEGLFLLVVVGEFNAGKSTLINALLGAPVMREGVTPTTDRVTLIVHGERETRTEVSPELVRITHPAPRLRALALVDTPGTNAVITRHQVLTERFVPRADLILFVTSADRPFTESERAFLERIAEWGKKVTVVVNKADLLEDDAAVAEVLAYVRAHARDTLAHEPAVVALSARAASRAATGAGERGVADEATAGPASPDGPGGLTEPSGLTEPGGLAELERLLADRVDVDRVRLKLEAGLGVGWHVAADASAAIEAQRELLRDDRRTLDDVDRQQAQWAKDVAREGRAYLDRVKTVLLEVERRGEVFFDDTVRLGRLITLLRAEKVRAAFEERVLRDAAREIDEAVAGMSDWFVERTLQQWEDVVAFVSERRKAGDERVVGEVGGRFRYDRAALIGALRQRAEGILEGYDVQAESRRLAEALQASVLQTGLLEVGGLGLGAAIVALVTSTAWDLTGIAAGLTVMGLGLLVLPRRRAKAKRELHRQMQALRDGLEGSLGRQLDEEVQRANERLTAAVAPYTRFVRAELERLDALADELAVVRERLADLRAEASQLTTAAD
ncbi:MAG: dynamin family protein [Trueperaceae bacterium]